MSESGAHGHLPRLRGIYAITPDDPSTSSLVSKVSAALAGGVRLVQYRNKLADKSLAHEQAACLRRITASVGAMLIVNDDIELALAVSADGVHLGQDDGLMRERPIDLSALRKRAPPVARHKGTFLVGISCYRDMVAARAATAAGADYIAFGSFFPSPTKPLAELAGLPLILEAKQEISLPIVAIGGITAENAPQLIGAGADVLAVISSLFAADDIRRQAQILTSHFSDHA